MLSGTLRGPQEIKRGTRVHARMHALVDMCSFDHCLVSCDFSSVPAGCCLVIRLRFPAAEQPSPRCLLQRSSCCTAGEGLISLRLATVM